MSIEHAQLTLLTQMADQLTEDIDNLLRERGLLLALTIPDDPWMKAINRDLVDRVDRQVGISSKLRDEVFRRKSEILYLI